jgi:S1-C subfamily serine protease
MVLRIAAVSITVGLIGGVAAVALTRHSPQPVLTSARSVAAAPQAIQAAASSLVGLRISPAGMPSSQATGLVVDKGALVATTASIPIGARVTMTSAERVSLSAVVVATDPIAGLTLLRPTSSLPAPTTAMASASGLEPATEVWVSSSGNGPISIRWASTSLRSPDAPVVIQTVGLGTLTDTSSSSTMAGAVLVASDGTMLGIAAPQLGLHSWLPVAMVEQLAAAMPTGGSHGCLRIEARTATAGGVRVVSIDADSPALTSLAPGDRLIAIDGQALSSISELLDALYTRSPGSSVTITFVRQGTVATADVVLASST